MGGNSAILLKFKNFSEFILANKKSVSPRVFSQQYSPFVRIMKRDEFCTESEKLATALTKENENGFAGIIYSTLCKVTEFFPNELEKFALKGYEIAQSNGDYVHMMARLNNLRKVYDGRPEKLYDYVQTLYKQEKCLKQLTRHYDECVRDFQSVIREPATLEQYEGMLAYVQTEIGKLTKKKHPNDALNKLLSARHIFEKQNNIRSVNYIDMLIGEIRTPQRLNVHKA